MKVYVLKEVGPEGIEGICGIYAMEISAKKAMNYYLEKESHLIPEDFEIEEFEVL